MHPAEQYARDVIKERIPACKWVRLACERYFRDKADKNFPYRHIPQQAQHAIDWVQFYCRNYKGRWKGEPIQLLPWQQFIYWNLFGWYDQRTGTRRFRIVYVEVPKKNGKTTGFIGPLAPYKMLADGEAGSEFYYAASTRSQAGIAFRDAKAMVRADPYLRKNLRIHVDAIFNDELNCTCKTVSSEAGNTEGLNVDGAGIDEYHEHDTSEVLDVIVSSTIARTQPIVFVITTAGYNTEGPCYQMHITCQQILEQHMTDERMFCIMYSVDEGDDFKSPSTWAKANPSMGHTITEEDLRTIFNNFRNENKIAAFKTKHLNMWLNSASGWLPDEAVKRMFTDKQPELHGLPCFGGLDLASVSDLTALALLWPLPDGSYWAKLYYWLPRSTMEAKRATGRNHLYEQWEHQQRLEVTESESTDYRYIRKRISGYSDHGHYTTDNLTTAFKIQSIGIDPYNATHLITELNSDGIVTNELRQGVQTLGAATKELERLILNGALHMAPDPIFRWMMKNVHIIRDVNENIKISKSRSRDKIDGVSAMINALKVAMDAAQHTLPDDMSIMVIK